MTRRFTRVVEDFTCDHCGAFVTGSGYTNHCPHCLWSKHVDKNPGDRLEICRGPMEPIIVEKHRDSYKITHRCHFCGLKKRNEVASEDSLDTLISIAKRAAQ